VKKYRHEKQRKRERESIFSYIFALKKVCIHEGENKEGYMSYR